MKAVRIDKYGGLDELKIEEIAKPTPGNGQVLVKVKAAGINPGEIMIREGKLAKMYPWTLPMGEGSDFAGVVAEVGKDITNFAVGDEVIGFTDKRASHAEYVSADINQLIAKPAKVSWEQGGGLFVAGTTAYAAVRAVSLQPGDTVVVSAAAGGVGSLVIQLARDAGATVIGLAGESNQQWLSDHGVVPVIYGDGQADRIRNAAQGKIDAFIDLFGNGYVELALALGVDKERINTIIDFEAVSKYGIKSEGSAKAGNIEVLAELAGKIANGKLEFIVDKVYPLTDVKSAYIELEKRHTRGKIILKP
ncbi:NADP-dependent oxidoreductase [Mucilaginibacter sp.]